MRVEVLDQCSEPSNADLPNAWANEIASEPLEDGAGRCPESILSAGSCVDQPPNMTPEATTSTSTKNERMNRTRKIGSSANEPHDANTVIRLEQHGNNTERGQMRVLLEKDYVVVDKRKTLLTLIIRDQKVQEKVVFLYKHSASKLLIWVTWLVCHANYLAMSFKYQLIPPHIYAPMQLVFCFNFFMHHSIFLRVDIIKQLIQSFSFWFAVVNTFSFYVCFVFLWGSSLEVFCASVHSLLSILLMLLYDSHAGKHKGGLKATTVIGMLSIIPFLVVISFHLVDFDREVYRHSQSGIIIIDFRLQAIDSMTTMIIYLLRIIYANLIQKSRSVAFLSSYYVIRKTEPIGQFKNINMGDILNEKAPSVVNVRPLYDNLVQKSDENGTQGSSSAVNISGDSKQSISARENVKNSNARNNQEELVIGITSSKIFEYNPQQTVMSLKEMKKLRFLTVILKSKVYNLVGLIMCLSSALSSIPIATGLVHNFPYTSIMIVCGVLSLLFMIIHIIFTSNVFILNNMTHSFDFWYVGFLCVKILICSCILCGWNSRLIFWCLYIVSTFWFMMIDSFKPNYRRLSYTAIISAMWSLTIAILCKVNAGSIFIEERYIYFQDIPFISPKITLSSSLLSMSIFLSRFFWSFYKNPSRILFMNENKQVTTI